jgi:hypothetical protein
MGTYGYAAPEYVMTGTFLSSLFVYAWYLGFLDDGVI